jgi:hypothetical protein
MAAVDDAERRGDAEEALLLMSSRLLGPDGQPFWRPARVSRLTQVVLLGSTLPRWAVSRWIVAQAHDWSAKPGDPVRGKALRRAIEVRGGTGGLSTRDEVDAQCKIFDHDWVFRQLYLYDLGALARFVRLRGTPDLLAGADRIHDWARTPMEAFRLVERTPGTVTWDRVAGGERVELANIGTAAVVVPGQYVLGRLVPIDHGHMFEGAPLVVPRGVAERVAGDPASWVDAVQASRTEIQTGGYDDGLAHDVRDLVWQLVLRDPAADRPPVADVGAHLARRALALARTIVADGYVVEPDDVDPWSCLRAALVSLSVVTRLPAVADAGDEAVLDRLGDLLAPPVDTICRDLARKVREIA